MDDFIIRQVGSKQTAHEPSTVTIIPTPGLVIKSKIQAISTIDRPQTLLPNTKIFINLCHAVNVPKPDIPFDPNIVYPLIMNNQWEIPIITSSIRESRDKKNQLCYVCDCCINTECYQWVEQDHQLKEIVIEWCVESCELREFLQLDRTLKFPNLKFQKSLDVSGIPPLQILQNDICPDANEPSTLLQLKKDLLDTATTATDDEKLPPLFPQDDRAPLIQEIDHLPRAKPVTPILKDVVYEVKMRKPTSLDRFKLIVEIIPNINSASDFSLQYNVDNNELILHNTNLQLYKKKVLQIPLPNIFNRNDINKMKCFYTKKDHKFLLYI